MPVNGITHAGIATDGSRFIYYAGGSASAANATQQVFGSTDAFSYDTVTGTYTRLPSLPAPRMGGGLGWVGGKLYYFGGNNITRTQDTGDTWMLDLAGEPTSWVAEAPMPDPRNHIGFATSGGLIYAVGGQHLDKSSTAQGELDRYDPASNTWTTLPAMPLPRGHVMDSTFFLDGHLVVAAGWTTTNVSAAVLAYNPATATWAAWPNLPEPRTSTTVKGLSGGRIFYCCGSAGTSSASGWIGVPSVPPTGSPTATPSPQPTAVPTTTPPTTTRRLPSPSRASLPPSPPWSCPSSRRTDLATAAAHDHPGQAPADACRRAQVDRPCQRRGRCPGLVHPEPLGQGDAGRAGMRQQFVPSNRPRHVRRPAGVSHVSLHALTGHLRLSGWPLPHRRVRSWRDRCDAALRGGSRRLTTGQ